MQFPIPIHKINLRFRFINVSFRRPDRIAGGRNRNVSYPDITIGVLTSLSLEKIVEGRFATIEALAVVASLQSFEYWGEDHRFA